MRSIPQAYINSMILFLFLDIFSQETLCVCFNKKGKKKYVQNLFMHTPFAHRNTHTHTHTQRPTPIKQNICPFQQMLVDCSLKRLLHEINSTLNQGSKENKMVTFNLLKN